MADGVNPAAKRPIPHDPRRPRAARLETSDAVTESGIATAAIASTIRELLGEQPELSTPEAVEAEYERLKAAHAVLDEALKE